jgi:putative transposase
VYHVLNRGVGRRTLFHKPEDYAAFERVLAEAHQRVPIRILAWCLMPNHWHLVLWPRREGELSAFMQWLTHTHTQRWHAHYHSSGTGHLYQGRFKSFAIQEDPHLLLVLRYVERNALRAGLVDRAEQWRWSSLGRRCRAEGLEWLSEWPVDRPEDWTAFVNEPQSAGELAALRQSVDRGRPFGEADWQRRIVHRLDLAWTFRPRGRPRQAMEGEAI